MSNCKPETEDGIKCRCDNCDWTGLSQELEDIVDIQERINAGCIVPAGECPCCNALAYYADEAAPSWTAQHRLDRYDAAMRVVGKQVQTVGADPDAAILPNGTISQWDERLRTIGAEPVYFGKTTVHPPSDRSE